MEDMDITSDDDITVDGNNTTDNDTHSLPCCDPAMANLKLKLSRIALELDIDFYQNPCVDLIFDYTIIYMKSFIRGMARHKRKYNIQCPALTGKSNIAETNNKNVVEDKPVHEKLWPWQVKINWEVVKEENIKFLDETEVEDTQDLSLMFFKRPSIPVKYGERKDTENKDTDASCLKSGSSKTARNSSNIKKRTNPAKKQKLCDTKETAVKETNENLISEVENCDCKFNMKDFVDFLKSDPNAIPLRSVYELFQKDAQEKLAKNIRIFDFYNNNKIKKS